MSAAPVLSVRNLSVQFPTARGVITPVRDVSFDVQRSGCIGLVGESGSGKSVTALAIMRLLNKGRGAIAAGSILLDGVDLVQASAAEMQKRRGRDIAMVFQEPMTSLNPVMTAGAQIAEAVRLHTGLGQGAAFARAVDALALVGIPDPARRARSFPHELSGGMRQRVMIAMALACEPKVLIADEPTTALDVTIQAQILDLLRRLRERVATAIVMITHDLGVVAELADEVVVMYAGRCAERRETVALFETPGHPYTEGLLASIPRLDDARRRLSQIRGTVPSPFALPTGCSFHPRCGLAQPICAQQRPPDFALEDGGAAACWRHNQFAPLGAVA